MKEIEIGRSMSNIDELNEIKTKSRMKLVFSIVLFDLHCYCIILKACKHLSYPQNIL